MVENTEKEKLENELSVLEGELLSVSGREELYLPDYGYSLKDEIVELIKEDIASVRKELDELTSFDYTDRELEDERTNLCVSQGLSRYI